jgi:tripartite-type tricarboxylate transporter receptor subunit TctC
MNKRLAFAVARLVAVVATISTVPAQAAESLEEFYKNKTIKVIVGSEAGGGYDIYARILVKYMGKYIPGNPNFIVQNMVGAGSISATNNIYNVQAQDGTVFGIIQRSALFSQILGETGALYDVTKFNWMGSANNEAGIMYTWHTAKVKTFDDLTKYDSLFGASGPNESEAFPSMLVNMIGAKIKVIPGYGSNSNVNLAIERGEVEGIAQSWSTLRNQHPDWIRDKKVNLLAQMSLTKDPDMPPEVPLIMDLVGPRNLKPEYSAEESETLWRIMLAQKAMGRPFVMGPGVPPDRVAMLRKAFAASLKEPGYLEDAAKAKVDVTPVSGDEIQDMVTRLATTPKSTLNKLEQITKYRK